MLGEMTQQPSHLVFATRNTEYHLRDLVCVAVRDRRTGRWHVDHMALSQVATCMFAQVRGGWRQHRVDSRRIGSVLHFGEAPQPLTTGSVRVVYEPEAAVISSYTGGTITAA